MLLAVKASIVKKHRSMFAGRLAPSVTLWDDYYRYTNRSVKLVCVGVAGYYKYEDNPHDEDKVAGPARLAGAGAGAGCLSWPAGLDVKYEDIKISMESHLWLLSLQITCNFRDIYVKSVTPASCIAFNSSYINWLFENVKFPQHKLYSRNKK